MKKSNSKISDSKIIEGAIKSKGTIKSIKLTNKRKKKNDLDKTLYQIGGVFKLISNAPNVINGISYIKPKSRKAITLPCFMGTKPTYYVRNNVLEIIFLIGNEPCDLHRMIFSLDYSCQNDPNFTFIVDPMFENCNCGVQVAYAMGTAGGGTWPPQ